VFVKRQSSPWRVLSALSATPAAEYPLKLLPRLNKARQSCGIIV